MAPPQLHVPDSQKSDQGDVDDDIASDLFLAPPAADAELCSPGSPHSFARSSSPSTSPILSRFNSSHGHNTTNIPQTIYEHIWSQNCQLREMNQLYSLDYFYFLTQFLHRFVDTYLQHVQTMNEEADEDRDENDNEGEEQLAFIQIIYYFFFDIVICSAYFNNWNHTSVQQTIAQALQYTNHTYAQQLSDMKFGTPTTDSLQHILHVFTKCMHDEDNVSWLIEQTKQKIPMVTHTNNNTLLSILLLFTCANSYCVNIGIFELSLCISSSRLVVFTCSWHSASDSF